MKYPDWFKDWITNLREDAAEFGAFRASEIGDTADLHFHYNQFLIDLAALIEEEDLSHATRWLKIGERTIGKITDKLAAKFEIPAAEKSTGEYREGTLFGYPIIDGNNPPVGATRRKQLWLSLPALIEYILDVPYPAGIEVVYNENGVAGYYLWVEK